MNDQSCPNVRLSKASDIGYNNIIRLIMMKPSKCFRSLNLIITIKTEIKSIYPQSVVSAITHSVTSVGIGQQIKITQLKT